MNRLSRGVWSGAGPPRPVRAVHLGLGAFHRSHQAWYTQHAAAAEPWGIAAFTGRSPDAAALLAAQDGLFTLVERGPAEDRLEVVASIAEAHDGANTGVWTARLTSPRVALVTLTVTEAGYHLDAAGHLDLSDPEVAADAVLLRRRAHPDLPEPALRTMPGRLAAGLRARRRAGAGPLAVVPCDNLVGNGAATRTVVLEMCEAAGNRLAEWAERNVSFISTVVDRITPTATRADLAVVRHALGRQDLCAAVAEPYSEWVLSGDFPAGRPAWEAAGARFVPDVAPYAERKLWLLNGGHSLLAYAGGALGHTTVAAAAADPRCRAWLEEWWNGVAPVLRLPAEEVAGYRATLLERFGNPRIAHPLRLIARDGSFKLAQRVAPVIDRHRAAGRSAPRGAVRIVGAWLAHLRRGVDVSDPRSAELLPLVTGKLRPAARAVLEAVEAGLGSDDALTGRVAEMCREMETAQP
ncbi:MAG: mannitol dehydrogenase family protein [Candidatus Dormibacteria bacterium]